MKDDSQYTTTTSCNKLANCPSQYLDRHNVRCELGEAMTHWHVGSYGCDYGNGGDNMNVEYNCMALENELDDKTGYTGCNLIDGQESHYLDRHDIRCSDGYALISWKLND